MIHIKGIKNVADHLSRLKLPVQDVSHLNAFISVFDKSALLDAIIAAQ